MPALIKILAVFGAVLLVARLRVPLGLALLAGGLLLDGWAGTPLADIGRHLLAALAAPELGLVLVMTGLIVEVGRFVTETRNADEILNLAARWGGRHGRAFALVLMPAAIGLIPMPAGALFSAPFVGQAAGDAHESSWKTTVNYWFRHIWEYWWPLYPGVIVAMSVFPVSAVRFVGAELIFTPVALIAGYYFLIRPQVKALAGDAAVVKKVDPRRAWLAASPLLAILAALLLFALLPAAWRPGGRSVAGRLLPVIAGLVVAIGVIVWDEWRHARAAGRSGWPRLVGSTLLQRKSLGVYGSLAGVLVFKSMLDQSAVLPLAARELAASGVPVAFAVAGLPFLAGIVTGVAVGFTGISFPLVVALMAAPGSGLTPLSTLVLAYGWGYTGMMLSPIHLCLLVSRDYFSADLRAVYRRTLPCLGVIVATSLAAHLVLGRLGI